MGNTKNQVNRGDIWTYRTNNSVELGLVVSNNVGNKYAQIVTIARIKEWNKKDKKNKLATQAVYRLDSNQHKGMKEQCICFEQQMICSKERLIEKIEATKNLNLDYYLRLIYTSDVLKEDDFPTYQTGIRQFDAYRLPATNVQGSEQDKERIVYVISNNVLNEAGYVTVVPITSKKKQYMPTHVSLYRAATGLEKNSTLLAEHTKHVPLSEFMNADKLEPLPEKYRKSTLEAVYIATAKKIDVVNKIIEHNKLKKKNSIKRR